MQVNSKILLATLNARFQHTAFGLRYLLANLKELESETKIAEFTISQNPRDIVESILSYQAPIVGFGIYIWNTHQTYEVISLLKKISPQTIVVLGGPEISYEHQNQLLFQLADFTIQGEADHLFYEFCREYFSSNALPKQKFISSKIPEISQIILPYSHYSDEDIQHRVIYVEASRGCPYKCEYCLSSLDKSVRNFDLDSFLQEMDKLIARGARSFKFVDRTFNLSIQNSTRILKFFLDRMNFGLFLHFEMVPDRLPQELKGLIQQFPAGSLQFEIGVQTWSPEVASLVSRRQDYKKIEDNFNFLVNETGVHIHADLIAGLPGETLESFAIGFDALTRLRPEEIQVGILKRLKGTPIIRHDQNWEMLYEERSPFQVIRTKSMSFYEIQRLTRFSKFWDLYGNSGNFKKTTSHLQKMSEAREKPSFFSEFFEFCLFLESRHAQGHGISLIHLVESAWIYLTEKRKQDPELIRSLLIEDYCGTIKRDIPPFLRQGSLLKPSKEQALATALAHLPNGIHTPMRQARHQGTAP